MSCRPPLISKIETPIYTEPVWDRPDVWFCMQQICYCLEQSLGPGWAAHAGGIQTTSQSRTTAECMAHLATSSMLPQVPVRSRMMHGLCSAPFPSQAARNSLSQRVPAAATMYKNLEFPAFRLENKNCTTLKKAFWLQSPGSVRLLCKHSNWDMSANCDKHQHGKHQSSQPAGNFFSMYPFLH